MIGELINEQTFQRDVKCDSWEELVDIAGAPLVTLGLVSPSYLESIKETVMQFGAYMVLVDDIIFYHGRPEAGVNQISMSLALLKKPVYLKDRQILAAFVFAAVDHDSHIKLLQELVMLLQDMDFLELLRRNGSKEKIFQKLKEAGEKDEI